MSRISIKGVLAGALFGVIAGFIASFIVILIVSKTTGATTGADVKAIADSSPFTVIWSSLVTIALLTTGGYLAAKVAGKGPLLNGTLSSFLYVLSGLYMLTGPYPEYWARNAIATVAAPFLGLLGGYLYARRRRNFLQV
jgi:hypothetical protein